MTMDPNDPNDAWQLKLYAAVDAFGTALEELHKTNPWPHHPVLPQALHHLAGDLWEAYHFPAAEAREAWEGALREFP